MYRYLGVPDIYDEELEIFARLRGDILEEVEKLEALMRMNGEHSSRSVLNWWLERLANCVEMGGQIVKITGKSATYFNNEKKRLTDKWSRMFEIQRPCISEEEDDYYMTNKEEFNAEKKTLSEVKKLAKEWDSKANFTQRLVNRLRAAEKVYSSHVKEVKYQKPSPRILNRRHCQFTSSK